MAPTLLVHGIWDSAARLAPLCEGLLARGIRDIVSLDLRPNDGSATIAELASQVQVAADALGPSVDLVGFSMGALISRYYIQRLSGRGIAGGPDGRSPTENPDGRARIRRFVSIAGPHHGTLTAYALPLAGVRQMRPNSSLLQDLASDLDPWGAVEVHTVTTPFDLMIVPSRSGELPGSKSHRTIRVKMHRWMITDPRVLDHVAQVLLA